MENVAMQSTFRNLIVGSLVSVLACATGWATPTNHTATSGGKNTTGIVHKAKAHADPSGTKKHKGKKHHKKAKHSKKHHSKAKKHTGKKHHNSKKAAHKSSAKK
jgi:hypothetical protein